MPQLRGNEPILGLNIIINKNYNVCLTTSYDCEGHQSFLEHQI
jgi:hypothetical protein